MFLRGAGGFAADDEAADESAAEPADDVPGPVDVCRPVPGDPVVLPATVPVADGLVDSDGRSAELGAPEQPATTRSAETPAISAIL
ncbi:hypothetical protein [Flexivirga sp. B27]